MTTLAEFASAYSSSRDIADDCTAAGLPFAALFARMRQPDGAAVNSVSAFGIANPAVTAEHFAEIDAFFAATPERAAILQALADGAKRNAPHLWAEAFPVAGVFRRADLFSFPIFQGVAKAIAPRDEMYTLAMSVDRLREWLEPYRDAYAYRPEVDDCDDQAARVAGYAARCPHPRPQVGMMGFTGYYNGAPAGHRAAFTVTGDGELIVIEGDGTLCPLVAGGYEYRVAGEVMGRWERINIVWGTF